MADQQKQDEQSLRECATAVRGNRRDAQHRYSRAIVLNSRARDPF